MQTIGHRALGILGIGALLLLPADAGAESMDIEALVPGEMLTDEEIDPYYGKGTEGFDIDITGDHASAPVYFEGAQNNVATLSAEINPNSGAEQGFATVLQYEGDNGQLVNFILVNVLINSVQYGAPVQAIMEDQALISTGTNTGTDAEGAHTVTITATADIENAFSATVDVDNGL
jgi:hypothetical protein